METKDIIQLWSVVSDKTFVSSKDLMKEISKDWHQFKIVMDEWKPVWVYMWFDDRKSLTSIHQKASDNEKNYTGLNKLPMRQTKRARILSLDD